MLFTIILKNLLIILKNLIFLRNLISNKIINKNVFLLCFIVFINLYILPNTAFCDSMTTDEIEATPDGDVQQKQEDTTYEKIQQFLLMGSLFFFSIALIGGIYLYFFDNMPPPEPDDFLPIDKKPYVPYVQSSPWDAGFVLNPQVEYLEIITNCLNCGVPMEPSYVECCDKCRYS